MSEQIEGIKKRVVVAGSSGFIGTRLLQMMASYDVVTLDRNPRPNPNHEALQWDGKNPGEWVSRLEGAHAVINLAGSPISVKWDDENREKIRSSRVDSTRAIGRAISNLRTPPSVWINASAAGYYGDRGDTVLYESAEAGEGFLSEVCRSWEAAAEEFDLVSTRLVLLRTGFALGRDGGAFRPLKKVTQLGLGGSVGSGNQWIPWIHLDDLCRMFLWAMEKERVRGPVNGSAAEPVRNREFMTKLRKELSRPWSPPAPSFALKILGELGGPDPILLLGSLRAIPRTAIDNGFTWTHPTIGEAFHDLVSPVKGDAFLA